ncbi:MAG: hypothetical protein NTW60_02280 [Candidatus Wolfebacteria bacterium]|nr:hypothetical protein [Candidatus Wolfebacteria bacterium]
MESGFDSLPGSISPKYLTLVIGCFGFYNVGEGKRTPEGSGTWLGSCGGNTKTEGF